MGIFFFLKISCIIYKCNMYTKYKGAVCPRGLVVYSTVATYLMRKCVGYFGGRAETVELEDAVRVAVALVANRPRAAPPTLATKMTLVKRVGVIGKGGASRSPDRVGIE